MQWVSALELVWVSLCKFQGGDERAKRGKKKKQEAMFTQGSADGLLFSWASGVRIERSCCTATVTRVTKLQQLSSAASRCLGIRTFRTGVKDDKEHTFHPCLFTLHVKVQRWHGEVFLLHHRKTFHRDGIFSLCLIINYKLLFECNKHQEPSVGKDKIIEW